MKLGFKSLFAAMCALGTLANVGVANADSHMNGNNCCNTCDDCCDRWDRGVTAPSAHCATECESGFYAGAEALFWQTCRDQLDFVVSDDTAANIMNVGTYKYIDFSYDVGVRAYLGYVPCDSDGWDYQATFVYFNPDEKASATQPTGGTLYATVYHPAATENEADSASANFEIDYYTLDITAGRPYHVSETFIIRPFGGARFLWLDQDLQVTYTNGDFDAAGDLHKWTSEYWAGGFIGGAETAHKICDLCDGTISTFGRGSTSIVYGDAEARYNYASGTVFDIRDDQDCLMSVGLEAAGGINWEGCFCDTAVTISVGSEMVKWFGVPVERRFNDAVAASPNAGSTGCLGFQGFFVSGRVDF